MYFYEPRKVGVADRKNMLEMRRGTRRSWHIEGRSHWKRLLPSFLTRDSECGGSTALVRLPSHGPCAHLRAKLKRREKMRFPNRRAALSAVVHRKACPAGVSEEELGFLTVRSKDGLGGATEHWRKCCFD